MASYGHEKKPFNVGDYVRVKPLIECTGIKWRGDSYYVSQYAGRVVKIVDFDWTGESGFMFAFHDGDDEWTSAQQLEATSLKE